MRRSVSCVCIALAAFLALAPAAQGTPSHAHPPFSLSDAAREAGEPSAKGPVEEGDMIENGGDDGGGAPAGEGPQAQEEGGIGLVTAVMLVVGGLAVVAGTVGIIRRRRA